MIGKRGYWLIYLPKVEWYLEHHYIWERYHKRKVPKGFNIHHKDFNPLNNNIDNLELMTASEHLKLHYTKRNIGSDGRFLPN